MRVHLEKRYVSWVESVLRQFVPYQIFYAQDAHESSSPGNGFTYLAYSSLVNDPSASYSITWTLGE